MFFKSLDSKDLKLNFALTNLRYQHVFSMTLLELSDALSQKCRDTNRTMVLLHALQNKIEAGLPTGNLRDLVLRSLYTHIDSDDEILVSIARALLKVRNLNYQVQKTEICLPHCG